ncbi:hypothetical protein J4573_09820 [Actinomadura barringtoniae]|uniref:Glutamine amidotransferase type-2 domain-containing protein n=1 Tax=Actinomadura barringtoniae TaxID=1427535 RepID=A0A939T5Q4_9ACTN|nr:hypothetical protein [Actinomadura barringtoniae]MBO2447382.1 hypothetical protein [Actinomadura barringtoniae]
MLRSPLADHPGLASEAFVALGTLAEERGTDSAGVALLSGRPVVRDTRLPAGRADARRSDMRHAACRVVKGRGRFSEIWRDDLRPHVDASPVVLGHTRWATQGSPFDLVNASPLVVPGGDGPGIVATHNGDVEAGALRERFALPPATGTTDSERVFQLLAGCRRPADVTQVLGTLVGRAALAWVDRARPDRVHLARAALSPLAIAMDAEQNLYWASNPRWYREVARETGVRFTSVVMLREGTYLQVGLAPTRKRPVPRVLGRAAFQPTARGWDTDPRVWTGFTTQDMERDRLLLRHRVVAEQEAVAC